MFKTYSLLSAMMAAFWATLLTFGLHGGPVLWAALFAVLFLACMFALAMCKSAADAA